MDLFKGCQTTAAVRKRYYKLAQTMHPDKEGGSNEQFQELQKQYAEACRPLCKKENFTQADMDAFIEEFLAQYISKMIEDLASGKDLGSIFGNLNNIADRITEDYLAADKKPTFGEVLKDVQSMMFKGINKLEGDKEKNSLKKGT